MTTITRFVDKVVTHDLRTTLTALVVVFVSLGSHLSASKQLLPESFTKGKHSLGIFYSRVRVAFAYMLDYNI